MGSLPQPPAGSNNGWSSVTEAGGVLKRADTTQQACIHERTSLFFELWRGALAEGKPPMYQSLMSKPQTRQLLTAAQGLSLAHYMGKPIPHLDSLLENVKLQGAMTGVSAHGVQSLLNYVSKTMEMAATRLVLNLRTADGQQQAAHQAASSMLPIIDSNAYAYDQDEGTGGGKGAAKAARSARAARRGGAPTPAPMAPMPPPPAVPSPVPAPPPPPIAGMVGPGGATVLPGNIVIAPPPPPATGGSSSRISPSQKKSGGTKRKDSSGTAAASMPGATASTGSMPGYTHDAPTAKRAHVMNAGTPSDGAAPVLAPTPPPGPEQAVHAGMMPMMPGATHIGPHGPSPLGAPQPVNGMIPSPPAAMNGMIPTPAAPTMNGMVPMPPAPGMNGMVPTGSSFMPTHSSAFAANSMVPLGDMPGGGMGGSGMIPNPMHPVPMPPLGASSAMANTAAATSMASLSAAPSGPLLVDNAGLMSAPSQPSWMMNFDSMLPVSSTGPLPSLGLGGAGLPGNPGSSAAGSGAFGSLFTPGNTGSATAGQDASSLATQGVSQGHTTHAGWPAPASAQQSVASAVTGAHGGQAAQPATGSTAQTQQGAAQLLSNSTAGQAAGSAAGLAALGSGELLLSTNTNPWGVGGELAEPQDSMLLLQPASPAQDATAMFLTPDSPLQPQQPPQPQSAAAGDTAGAQQPTTTVTAGSPGGKQPAQPGGTAGGAAGGIAAGEQGNVKRVGGLHNQSPTTHDAADLSS